MLRTAHILLSFFALSCGEPPVAAPPSAIDEFKAMHSAVYDVYRIGLDRDAIHQRLSESFSGEALTLEYINHFTTLVKMNEEETAIDVRTIDYNSIEPLHYTMREIALDVDWSVGGIVTHQSHQHTRLNRYRAVFRLAYNDDGLLRITDTKMRNLERIQRAGISDDEFFNAVDDNFDAPSSGGGYLDPLDLIDGGLETK